MKNRLTFINRCFSLKIYSFITVFFGLIASGCGVGETVSEDFDADFRLIVPTTAAPTVPADIDGLVTDLKWNDSFRLDLIEGVSPSGMIMEGVADATNFYLYFEVDETNFSGTDYIAIGLNPTAAANDKRLLLLSPCNSGVCGPDATNIATDIDYFLDVDDNGVWEPQGGNGGVTARTSFAGGNVWTVEVSIPRAAPFNLPSNDYFGFYVNIIASSSFGVADEYTWPFDQDSTGGTLIVGDADDLPPESAWGNVTLDSTIGNGVRINSNDISTNHDTSTISWNQSNTFTAIAHNNTLSSGTLVTANNVRASFQWANFGLPSHSAFQRIPTGAAPAPGSLTAYQDILPTDSATYQFTWSVPPADVVFYQDNPHWCIRVELESSDPATVFYRQSAQRNMNFAATASPFLRKATIDTRGYKLPEGQQQHEYILEERFYNVDPKFKWESKLSGVTALGNQRYGLKVPAEKPTQIGLSVLPPMKALTPFKTISLKAGSSSDVTKLSMRPGTLVTLIVDDSVKRRVEARNPERVSLSSASLTHATAGVAGARVDVAAVSSSEAATVAVPATTGESTARRGPGLIWASWDGFEKSKFLINGAITLKVPKGASSLFLVPDSKTSGDNSQQISLRVYVTDLRKEHLRADPSLALDRNANGIVTLGANLPMVIYRGKRNTGKKIRIKGKVFDVYQSAGAFGYIVKGEK